MSNRLLFVLPALLMLGAACTDPATPEVVVRDDLLSAADYSLTVEVDRAEVTVGQAVRFTTRLADPDGNDITELYDIRTQLSPVLGVLADGDGVYRFTFAERYTYFASVDILGTTLVGTASVDVQPGPAAELRIFAEPPLVTAGEPVTMTAEIFDAYGNRVDGSVGYAVTPAASVAGDVITATAAGRYTVRGFLDGSDAEATDDFSVLAGDPASLSISLSEYDVELGEGVVVDITLLDEYGNESDEPVDLSTDPPFGTEAWGHFVRFDAEGRFTVHADLPRLGLHAEDGPVLVDSTGPAIRISEPDRGVEIPSAGNPTVTVAGSVAEVVSPTGMTVTINGQPASVNGSGLFTFQMTPQRGLNTIEVVATDGDGNVSDHFQTFLWGEFLPMGDPNEDGILARLNEGAIDTIEDMVDDLLDVSSLGSSLTGPLWNSGTWCPINVQIGSFSLVQACGILYANLNNVTLGGLDLELDAQQGYLDFFAEIAPFSVNVGLSATFTGCLFGFCASQTLSGAGVVAGADATQLWTDLFLSVNNSNEIEVALANTVTGLDGFYLNFYGLGFLSDFLNLITGWLTPVLEPILELVLAPIIEAQLPGLVESALAGIDIAADIPLLGATIELEALPQAISIDPNGMTITMETVTTTQLGPNAPATLGAWNRSDYSLPSYPTTPDFAMSLADNFVNQLLHSVWQAGVMDFSLDSDELGLDVSQLGDFVPLTSITFETMPLLPPVVGPSSSGLLEMAIGDMMVNVWGDPGGQYGLMMQLAVTILADADLAISPSAEIEFGVGAPVVVMDFVTSDWPDLDGEVVEDLMDAVVNMIVPMLTDTLDQLGGIPLPEVAGFVMANPGINREASPIYYITASGDLNAAAP